jgi:predicted O-linked N-acetylglucosamine transferase (SPINDLY family)
LKPDSHDALNNLGVVAKDQGRLEEAVGRYRQALAVKSDFVEALNNLADALRAQGKLDEAAEACLRALDLKPDYAEAHNTFGAVRKDQGLLDEAIASFRRAMELKPEDAQAHSNLLQALQYYSDSTLSTLAEAHDEYQSRHAAGLLSPVPPVTPVRDRPERLRLGFVSPDLGRHPVGYFLVRVLEHLDKVSFETHCYSDRIVKDDLSARIQAASTCWRDAVGMSDSALADQIRADGIDILFDLAGHTARNRLLVFARKPAPVQISWIGYEGTTGLAAIDYLLADRFVIPEGWESHFRERVLRIPDSYLCYEPPADAPPIVPPPCLKKGFVTFAAFSNPAKVSAQVVQVWAEILRKSPTSRLVMRFQGLGEPSVRKRHFEMFAARGVTSDRLDFLPGSTYGDYLAGFAEVDLVLDPFPFSGSTTTCESLWMGVPVVTRPGETFAGRHSLGHLTNVGLTETVAADVDDYVERAVALAADPDRLSRLRTGLRDRMADSPLCDGKAFAASFQTVLRDAWESRRHGPSA